MKSRADIPAGNTVPLGGSPTTLTCHYTNGGCALPAVWHLSWYDETLPAVEWENSLACQEHREEAERRGWGIGWRHRVLPACTLPGSLFRIADEGDDEDGFPISFCFHPFDIDELAGVETAAIEVQCTAAAWSPVPPEGKQATT